MLEVCRKLGAWRLVWFLKPKTKLHCDNNLHKHGWVVVVLSPLCKCQHCLWTSTFSSCSLEISWSLKHVHCPFISIQIGEMCVREALSLSSCPCCVITAVICIIRGAVLLQFTWNGVPVRAFFLISAVLEPRLSDLWASFWSLSQAVLSNVRLQEFFDSVIAEDHTDYCKLLGYDFGEAT